MAGDPFLDTALAISARRRAQFDSLKAACLARSSQPTQPDVALIVSLAEHLVGLDNRSVVTPEGVTRKQPLGDKQNGNHFKTESGRHDQGVDSRAS
jgi:hypothetical protein